MLFIDEAYYLYRPENERDYGEEAIEILLQVMENERDRLVVILAGYKDRMDEFFRSNPGCPRAWLTTSTSPTTRRRVARIGELMLARGELRVLGGRRAGVSRVIVRRMRRPRFAHARSVRNGIERARLRHANRVYEAVRTGAEPTVDELRRIEAQDILKSSVFDEDRPTAPEREAA